jgi:HAD superfamily hydrolase (TIGR01509 family)
MPEALVLDLFGTLVFFDDSRVPVVEIEGRPVPQTVAGLDDRLRRALPGVSTLGFLRELKNAGRHILAEKRRLGVEIPTEVRFERALRSLGAEPGLAAREAEEMARLHMDTLARAVVCPPGRAELLDTLARRHRLALLSNFDHGATARRVLEEAGLTGRFEVILVSAEEGLRKPSPEIFARCCARLGLSPAACVFVGDTMEEDVEGADAAGMTAVWVQPGWQPGQAKGPARAVLGDVAELPAWLEGFGLSEPGVA